MRILCLVLAVGCVAEDAASNDDVQAIGEVQNGFPSAYERALLMAANRTRSDPSLVKGAQSKLYPPQAPLQMNLDLEKSSRFHATMLAKGHAPLMHPSPCTLKADVSGC